MRGRVQRTVCESQVRRNLVLDLIVSSGPSRPPLQWTQDQQGLMEPVEPGQPNAAAIQRRIVDVVFDDASELRITGELNRLNYVERALTGGFPEAIQRTGNRRLKIFESYAYDLIDRDVTPLGEIQRRDELLKLFSFLSDRMATPLAVESIASALTLSAATVERLQAGGPFWRAHDDVKHLWRLRDKTGAQFHCGVLLYTGSGVISMVDRLVAAPIDSLWRSSL
jgi:hypothetical protein